MIWWYLFAPLLLANGDPTPALAFPYPSEEACTRALDDAKTAAAMDSDIIDAFFVCVSVEFDPSRYDRPPALPNETKPAPEKRLPSKDEARL